MGQRVTEEPPSLQEMAGVAVLSRYHLDRVFSAVTGLSPRRYMAAVRLATAKRLLCETQLRVTDVCFEVGYQSLGTFSSHFTQAVGVGPQRLRRLGSDVPWPALCLASGSGPTPTEPRTGSVFTGKVSTPDVARVFIFVGLFADPLPEGKPRSCALLTEPGEYQMAVPADGTYYLFGAALDAARWPASSLLPEGAPVWVGAAGRPVHVRNGVVSGARDLLLRPPQPTDPPIVVSLSALLAEQLTIAQINASNKKR
jgi:AraC-like DNA-binding protein